MLIAADFSNSTHGRIACTDCHQGRNEVLEKEEAHEGLVIAPSAGEASACGECHASTVEKYMDSLHVTQEGYFTAFARRGGDPDGEAFHGMFEARCANCHASCGQCHVSRPDSVGGGLTHGHEFRRSPSQTNQCTACHGSRVGDEFRGKNTGIPPDVHYLGGMNCMDCHDGVELHGDGTTPDHRFANDTGPQCLDCHPTANSTDSQVTHHAMHADRVACQVCHSVPYKNCYACHVEIDRQSLRFPSEIDFRIGRNTEVTARRPFEFVLVRHIPIAPDTFDPWGLAMPDYAAVPTWRLATPHNIQRTTPQTESCGACHDSLSLFLTPAYLDDLIDRGLMDAQEIEANRPVVVESIGGP